MASVMAARCLPVSSTHTCGLVTLGMVVPPGLRSSNFSLEGGNQFRNGSRGQRGRFGVRLR